jgi:ABC-2 type transport system permease protein
MNAFGRAVASEFRKVLSTRMWWVLGLILFGYVGLVALGLGLAFGLAPESAGMPLPADLIAPIVYSLATAIGYAIPVIYGAMSVTSELRHRTLTGVFLATPQRWIVLAAKAVAALVVGAFYGILSLLGSVGLGAVALGIAGVDNLLGDGDTWLMLARIVLAMALWALVGVGVGVLIPSQIGSIVAVIAFTQFVEPILRTAAAFVDWLTDVGQFLPGAAGDTLVGASIYLLFTAGGGEQLQWWQGGLVLAAYAVVFAVIGSLTTWRRDVS